MCTKTNEQATSIIVRRTEMQNPCAMARESQALPDFRQTITCKQWVACSQIYIYIYIYIYVHKRCNRLLHTNNKAKNPTLTYVCYEYTCIAARCLALSDSTRHNKEWLMQQQGLPYTCVCFSTCHLMRYKRSSHGTRGCANPQADQ